MPRRIAIVLLCAVVILVVVGSLDAAPAPLPKKTKEEPLLQRLRKKMRDRGYYLHELRLGPGPEEWTLVYSSLEPLNPRSKKSSFLTMAPIPMLSLRSRADWDVIVELVIDLAEIDEQERTRPPIQVRPLLRVRGGGLNDRK
jgi:hypothetical protein